MLATDVLYIIPEIATVKSPVNALVLIFKVLVFEPVTVPNAKVEPEPT